MSPKHFPILATVILTPLTALPAAAQTAPRAQQSEDLTVTGRKKDDATRRICKREASTGSIMRRSTCRTAADWERVRERSVVAMELAQEEEDTHRHVRELK